MRINAKTEYACLAMLELAARHESGEPVRIRDISETHGVPSRFLVQILLQLKGAGLVTSTRGAAGGYQLQKSPRDITLGQVMTVVDGPELTRISREELPPTGRVLRHAWRCADDARARHLASLSLAELADRIKGEQQSMYHI